LKTLSISSKEVKNITKNTNEEIIQNNKDNVEELLNNKKSLGYKTGGTIEELLNKINGLLKQAFEDRTKIDYTE
jgi:hypothetical protein